MFAFGSQGRIEERGNGDVEIRGGGKFAVFGGVEGALEVIDFGADVDASGKRFEETVGGDGVGERWEIGEITEGEMTFGDGSIRTEVADAQSESRIELRGVEEMEESALGIEAGNHGGGGDFFATGEYEAGDSTHLEANVANFGVGADFGAGLAGRFGEGASERAESSVRERSGADGMRVCGGAKKQNGGGTRRPWAKRGAGGARGRDHGAGGVRFGGLRRQNRDGLGAPQGGVREAFFF